VFAMSAFTITSIFVREPEQQMVSGGARRKGSLVEQFRAVKQLKAVHVMFVVLFVAQFSVMSVQPVLPVYIKQLTHGTGYMGTIAGFAFAVTGLADLLFSPFFGKRSDKLGYRRVLSISLLGAGLCYLPQAFASNIWMFVLGRFGLGMFVGGIMPTANALVGRLTPREQRGQVYGFTSSATFLGSFAGPLIGGAGSALFGIRVMLGLTTLLYLMNVVWVRWKVRDPLMQTTPQSSA
jgi:DHA1 family multidrug resistance protein-like MFS transporter